MFLGHEEMNGSVVAGARRSHPDVHCVRNFIPHSAFRIPHSAFRIPRLPRPCAIGPYRKNIIRSRMTEITVLCVGDEFSTRAAALRSSLSRGATFCDTRLRAIARLHTCSRIGTRLAVGANARTTGAWPDATLPPAQDGNGHAQSALLLSDRTTRIRGDLRRVGDLPAVPYVRPAFKGLGRATAAGSRANASGSRGAARSSGPRAAASRRVMLFLSAAASLAAADAEPCT